MNVYENGKIYKITNTTDDKIYIGSTINTLNTRFNGHKSSSRENKRFSNLYNHIRLIGVENFKIELIENYKCETQSQLIERENYYIHKLKPHLNTYAVLSQEEKKQKKKEYAAKNKDIIAKKKERIQNKS